MRSQQGGLLTMLFTSRQVTSPSPVQTPSRTSEVHSSSDSVCRATLLQYSGPHCSPPCGSARAVTPSDLRALSLLITPLSQLPRGQPPKPQAAALLERTYCVLHWSSNYLLFDFLENSAVRNILSEDFWTLDSIIFVCLCGGR